MKIVIFILVQLFFILLFSKTFGRCDDELPNEIKIAIRWTNFAEKKSLFKLAANEGHFWNERFKLSLFHVNRQFERTVLQPIASGITGHYDFAKLKIHPLPQQIGTQNQNAAGHMKEKKLRRKAKGKEEIGMEKSEKNIHNTLQLQGEDEYELQIRIISIGNWNIQKTVIKRLKKLPSVSEILICPFDVNGNVNPTEPCTYNFYNPINIVLQPMRNIFFRMNLQNNNKLILVNIKCTGTKNQIQPLQQQGDGYGVKYFGPVCPSDKYTLHFLVNRQYPISIPYNCDEAIYVNEENTYQFKNHTDGTLECKLLFNDNIVDGKSQGLTNTQMKQSNSSSNPSMSQSLPADESWANIWKLPFKERTKMTNFKIGKLMQFPAGEDQFHLQLPHQSQSISSFSDPMIQHATKLLQNSFTYAPNHPHIRPHNPGTQPHLSGSSIVHEGSLHKTGSMYDSQSKRRTDSNSKDYEWNEMPIMLKERRNPRTIEKSAENESTSVHGHPDPLVNLELNLDLPSLNQGNTHRYNFGANQAIKRRKLSKDVRITKKGKGPIPIEMQLEHELPSTHHDHSNPWIWDCI